MCRNQNGKRWPAPHLFHKEIAKSLLDSGLKGEFGLVKADEVKVAIGQ